MTSQGQFVEARDKEIVRKPKKETFLDGDFDSVTQHIVLPSVVDVLSPRSKTKTFDFKINHVR